MITILISSVIFVYFRPWCNYFQNLLPDISSCFQCIGFKNFLTFHFFFQSKNFETLHFMCFQCTFYLFFSMQGFWNLTSLHFIFFKCKDFETLLPYISFFFNVGIFKPYFLTFHFFFQCNNFETLLPYIYFFFSM